MPTSRGSVPVGDAVLLDCLIEPVVIDGLTIEVAASIGVASSPVHGLDADALLQHADVAMYTAKQAGTGVEAYSAESDHHDVRRLTLVAELRQAIDDDQIDVHYQPLVDSVTGRLVGVECLVRWQSPSYGNVPADEIIQMAETTGMINPLTDRVLATALGAAAPSGEPTATTSIVSVNLSMRNLLSGDLVASVERQLHDAGVPATALTLELTESCLIGDTNRTATLLDAARERSASRISIDDFGTGYSSLSYLSGLPVDELKIDRSFVDPVGGGGRPLAIVRAATHLAHELGLTVVAEGVEDLDTWRVVADSGCDVVQGYFISRPLSAEAFTHVAPQPSTGGNLDLHRRACAGRRCEPPSTEPRTTRGRTRRYVPANAADERESGSPARRSVG